MKNNLVFVGTAVPPLKIADVDHNAEQIIESIKSHSECGVIVFPELCTTGYTCADLFGSDLLLDKAEDALFRIAKETETCHGLSAVIGVPVRFENHVYNCAAFLSEGTVCAGYYGLCLLGNGGKGPALCGSLPIPPWCWRDDGFWRRS